METLNKKFLKKNKSAFTLVELIIVITILAILATIAFISFQGYSKNARDSNRTSTITNISKGLDIYSVQTGNFPEPDGTILSGTLNGVQLNRVGIIGETISRLIKMNKTPTDPIGGNNYAYGISADNKYYQIGVALENPESYNIMTKTTYADNGSYRAKVVGNYKYPLKYNGKLYSLPSLIFTGSGGDLTQTGSAYFVINNGQNIPYHPAGTLDNTQTTTQVLQSITGTGGVTLTGITLPTETSEQFKTLTSTSTTIQNLQQALGITDQTQLGNVIYGSSYNTNTSVNATSGGISGGGSSPTFLANCTNTSSSSGIIYTDSSGVEIGRVDNTGVTISGNPNSLTCAGNIIVCAGSGTGYVLQACNVGATTVYTNQTFTNGTTGARDTTINSWAGGLYQWGNNADISYAPTSTTRPTCTTNSTFSAGTFITGSGDWCSSQTDEAWGNSGTNANKKGPCPTNYHIPTGGASGEWQAIYNAGGWSSVSTNKGIALSNSLKLPFAGYRYRNDGTMNTQGTTAGYWSTTPNTTSAYSLRFGAGSINPASNYNRGGGFSLRCIKN